METLIQAVLILRNFNGKSVVSPGTRKEHDITCNTLERQIHWFIAYTLRKTIKTTIISLEANGLTT